jgi:Spy/CpxP family protein refolding chaperone
MVRFSNKFLAVVAALAVVAMAAQLAMAQNEQGRRGRGGPGGPGMRGPVPMTLLATVDTVQEALKLSDEQKDKVKSINDDVRNELKKDFENGGRPDFEKMRKMMDEASEKLGKVLDEGQQKRLMGVFVQVNGARALVDPAVEKALDISDDQKDKLHEMLAPPRGGRGEGRGEGRGAGKGEGRGEGKGQSGQGSFREQREKMEKEAMAVLTPDQQKKLEEVKGEKVDVDMSKLRGRDGAGRPGRDRGNRGEPKEGKSS